MTSDRLPIAPVTIDQDPKFSGYEVRQGDCSSGGLDWGEMIALITSLTRSPQGGPLYPMLTADEWADRKRQGAERAAARRAEEAAFVTLRLPKFEAERLSSALSDVLCWAAGFSAANYDRGVDGPMGIEQLRTLNIKLKAALEPADFEEVF